MTQPLCLAPVRLGSLELPNKLILPAMTMGFCDTRGRITQRFCDFYLSRAKGGPGLMVLEGAAVHPDGQTFARQFNLMDDSNVSGLAELVDALHERDVKVAVQLSHAGRLGRPNGTGRSA